jgi:hypothetical protein
VPIGHEDHSAVAVTPTISRSGFHQSLDLSLGEVLAGAQLAVGGGRLGVTVRFTVAGVTSLRWRLAIESASLRIDCRDNSLFSTSMSISLAKYDRLTIAA